VLPLDDYAVWVTSRLEDSNVPIAGAAHNVLYVATEKASIYAFDTDTDTVL